MGRIQREISEKGRLLTRFLLYPSERLLEEYIGAISAGLFEFAIVQNCRIEVRVPGRIATTARIGLTDASSPMNKYLIEPASVWLIFCFVAQVPLPEYGRVIPGRF